MADVRIEDFIENTRQTVIIQGIGFVGAAMIAAVANVIDKNGTPLYNVIGVDLPDLKNLEKIKCVNSGIPPIISGDSSLKVAYEKAHAQGNMYATSDNKVFSLADIVVIDINLDIKKNEIGNSRNYEFSYKQYMEAIENICNNILEDTLIVIESTVPPGTTEHVIYPKLKEILKTREIDYERIYLAHSYERVMPGDNYLDSITNYFRVYSGINAESKSRTRQFLNSFINTVDFPLRELQSTTSSEMSKVLENSYRAVNIAFIQEWTEYAEIAGVDLFEVLEAIKDRPTHKNIMAPGLGVGGYCLTKDALLADYGFHEIFKSPKRLEMSLEATNINDLMPRHTFDVIEKEISSLGELHIVILGVSYLNDVGDTRFTPSSMLYDLLLPKVKSIELYDPYVSTWEEKNISVNTELKGELPLISLVILTVKHSEFRNLSSDSLLRIFPNAKFIVDANNVLQTEAVKQLKGRGLMVISLGRGNV